MQTNVRTRPVIVLRAAGSYLSESVCNASAYAAHTSRITGLHTACSAILYSISAAAAAVENQSVPTAKCPSLLSTNIQCDYRLHYEPA